MPKMLDAHSNLCYPLVMTNSSPWKPWPIEIDDFPSELNLHLWLDFFHGYVK